MKYVFEVDFADGVSKEYRIESFDEDRAYRTLINNYFSEEEYSKEKVITLRNPND